MNWPATERQMTLRLYDSTRLDAARNCLRYFYYRHVMHLVPEGPAGPALVFGSSWGAAMDVLWANHKDLYKTKETRNYVIDVAHKAFLEKWTVEGYPAEPSLDELEELGARTPMTALEMLHSYVEKRENVLGDPGFELLSVEEPFAIPLDPNDATLWYVGRLDKVFRWRGSVLGSDHKTTSLYRVNGYFSSDWIDGWGMNDQVDGYSYALHLQYGDTAGGVWIDGALVHKKEHSGFKFIPIDKQMQQLDAWLWETYDWIHEIELNKAALQERAVLDTPYLAAFKKNRKSCVSVYGRCQFFDLCRMTPNPARIEGTPIGFKIKKWEPMDELKLTEELFKCQ